MCQDNFGIAYYNEIVKKTKKSDEVVEVVKQILTNQIDKEYILSFNLNESLMKVNNELERPNSFSFFSTDSNDKLYQNLKFKTKIIETEVLGKIFLIKDSLFKKDWTITKETKKIGKYTCILAKTIELSKVKDKKVVNVISAWFTTELPYSHGPKGYFGLPGLILEVSDNTTIIKCYEISFKDSETIKKPDKGEVVTQIKFDSIVKAKLKEIKSMKF